MQPRKSQKMPNCPCPVKCPTDLTKKIFVKDKQNCKLLFTLGKAGEAVSEKNIFEVMIKNKILAMERCNAW
jgi:hypothetical protein